MNSENHTGVAATLGRSDILRIAGNIEDSKVAAIERAGATAADLETAAAWASGLTGVMGEERRPLAGVIAQVYDILTADEDFGEDRD